MEWFKNILLSITESPLFGITISIAAYECGLWLNKKAKTPLVNPMVVAIIIIIAFLKLFNIPTENYYAGGNIITMLLAPATASLAVSIYNRLHLLKENFLPIVAGTLVGAVTSVISVVLLCKLFGINDEILISLIPKSVTTPIAIDVANSLGGISAVAVAGVMVTGIFGAIMSPLFIKWFRINNSVAAGLAIGASCHALGTSKAIEIGETEGAMGGIAIGMCGTFTVLVSIVIKAVLL